MTLRHWSRVTPYTAPCGFAECYVFAKQSPGPLRNGRGAHGGAEPAEPPAAPLLPKLRGRFAEFLNVVSPEHLGLLDLSTCVGLRYGPREAYARALFSAAWPGPLPPRRTGGTPSRLGLRLPAWTGRSSGRRTLPSASRTRAARGSGNVDPESIGYALPPRLRARLTLGGRTWPRKPWTFGGADSRRPFRYSCLHGRPHAVHGTSRARFGRHAALPYRAPSQGPPRIRLRASVPIIFGAAPLVQ